MSLSRRQTLMGLGIASGALLTGHRAEALFAGDPAVRLFPSPPACALTPLAEEGPYYGDAPIERANIAEDRSGLALDLVVRFVEANKCLALPDLRVDIWHADASGCYSGFQGQGDDRDVSTADRTFLRGTQHTDSHGQVRFKTVYPGWYAGRTPHIHIKAFTDEKRPLNGQVYFPEDVSEIVFAKVQPYNNRRHRRDTHNRDDRILSASGGGRESVCAVAAGARRLVASLTFGIGTDPMPKSQTPPPAGRKRTGKIENSCRERAVLGVDI